MPRTQISSLDLFFNEVLGMVKLIPIQDIVEEMYRIPKGFCPFHDDRHAGSFRVFKDNFYCFSCGVYGDGINFVQRMEDIGFKEAVLKIALHFDVITNEQLEAYQNGVLVDEKVKIPPRTYEEVYQDEEDGKRQSPDVLHKVYTLFSEGEGVVHPERRLSEAHKVYLMEERKLSERDIERIGFFTMPRKTRRFFKAFIGKLQERYGLSEDVLKGVPGFYCLDEIGEMTFVAHKGIGIPIRDERGRISGIQVRRDAVEDGGARYIWFSSSFANGKEGLSHGTGSGSPIHVSYPERIKRKNDIFITEGVFKSEQLAKTTEAISLSVQGIHGWKGKVSRVIDYLEEERGLGILTIHVLFDSDICENPNVYRAFREMALELKKNHMNTEIYYYWWPPEFGKGIDDLILNGFLREIKRIDFKTYIRAYDKMVQTLEKQHDTSIVSVDKEFVREAFERHIRPLFDKKTKRRGRK